MSLKTAAATLAAFIEDATEVSPMEVQPLPPEPVSEAQVEELAQVVLNYVLHSAEDNDTPEMIGEALVVGAAAAAEDAGVDAALVMETAVDHLDRMLKAAKRLL